MSSILSRTLFSTASLLGGERFDAQHARSFRWDKLNSACSAPTGMFREIREIPAGYTLVTKTRYVDTLHEPHLLPLWWPLS